MSRKFSIYDAGAQVGIRNAQYMVVSENAPEYIYDIQDWDGRVLASIKYSNSCPEADAWLIKNAFKFYLMLEKIEFATKEEEYKRIFSEFHALKAPQELLENCRHTDIAPEILKRDPNAELRGFFERIAANED